MVLAVLIAGTTALPPREKSMLENLCFLLLQMDILNFLISGAFSLFSVVSFPNEECTTTSSSSLNGVCKTAEECTDSGGTSMGNCASGFGICCLHK